MPYRRRFLETKLRDLTRRFKAVLVTGPRQAGKTSLLRHMTDQLFGDASARTVSFDTPVEIGAFRRDPELFFANHPGLVLLDEVQHVPDIFPFLKREIDRSDPKRKPEGTHSLRFFLTGSQHFHLMRGVTESLAGRVAVLDLWPFAVQELRSSRASETIALLEQPDQLEQLVGREYPINDVDDVLPAMLLGGYPPMVLEGGGSEWLESYRRTFVQRDIRDLSQVADLGRFDRFVALCAGRTGTIVNKAEIGRTVSIDDKTVDHWASLLESSYQLVALPAYHGNATKRLVKRPKWIFADSGLGLHLQAIRSTDALLGAPHFGHLFESFVVMEIRKLYGHAALPWSGHHWRTATQIECDLVLPAAGRLVPIEIKHRASLSPNDLSGIRAFKELYPRLTPTGLVISMRSRVERLARDVYNMPLGLLLNGP